MVLYNDKAETGNLQELGLGAVVKISILIKAGIKCFQKTKTVHTGIKTTNNNNKVELTKYENFS